MAGIAPRDRCSWFPGPWWCCRTAGGCCCFRESLHRASFHAKPVCRMLSTGPGDQSPGYKAVLRNRGRGIMPDLRRCADCHRAFEAEEPVYSGRDLTLRCNACRGLKDWTMSKRVYALLRTIEKLPPTKFVFEARSIDKETQRETAELTHQMITRVLERLPRVRPTFA